jgi:glycosyltransferase involved in cell wall biosynthesis
VIERRPVRVLWLTKGLSVGGIERLLCQWSAVRDASRVTYRVAYVRDGYDGLAPVLVESGTPVTSLGVRSTLDGRWVLRLRRLLADGGVDVVHAHAPDLAAVTLLLVRALPRSTRPKVVITDHNVWGDYRWLSRVAHRITCLSSDAHLAVSEAVRTSASRRAARRMEVLIPGVPIAAIRAGLNDRATVRRDLGVGDDDVLVITLANYRPAKRYPDLLRAIQLAALRGAPVRLAAVGAGPLELDMRALARQLGIEDRVHIVGLREDATNLLSGADLFALASDHEGGPLAVLEAMAAGLPVIATGVGAVPDLITDGIDGLIVPVGAPSRLADAIAALAGDPARRASIGQAAASRIEAHDVTRSAARLEELYVTLAGAG